MRENWDYVSMENYSKDTRELVDQASGIIAQKMKRIRDLERLVWAMALAAGGNISVSDDYLTESPDDGDLTFWRCQSDRTLRIEAKRSA